MGKTILMVAGEASGDLHGANLAKAILSTAPDLSIYGMGGRKMEEAGVRILYDSSELAVVGLTEVFPKLYLFAKAFLKLRNFLDKADLLVLIDYPDFNLSLAKIARRAEKKIVYFISPQVWAWRRGRVKTIAQFIHKMIVILPFEAPFYQKEGIDVEFVGHPLVNLVRSSMDKEEALAKFRLNPATGKIIALLPGSRKKEVQRLLPLMLKGSELIQEKIPHSQFLLPIAPGLKRELFEAIVKRSPVKVELVEGFNYDILNLVDLAIVASGTATLETALIGKPMVIVYKVSPISYFIGKRLIKVDHIGMVNILAQKRIVPELIQAEVTPQRIFHEVIGILNGKEENIREGLRNIKEILFRPDPYKRAAEIVLNLI